MPAPRDSRLETREARKKLLTKDAPTWRSLGKGLALGYRRSRWWVRAFTDGKYRRRSIGQADDFAEADGIEVLDYRQAVKRADSGAATEPERDETSEARGAAPYTVAEALGGYLEWYAAHRKALDTTSLVSRRHILPVLGSRPVAELTTKEIRRWHERLARLPALARSAKGGPARYRAELTDASEQKRRRQASANRVLTILKAALSHAFREGEVDSDLAWRRVKPFRGADVPRVRYLSAVEARRLVNACEPDFRSLARGALLSGCRYGELRALRVEDYHGDSGTIRIRESKGGKPRSVPLTDEGRELLETLTAGKTGDELVFRRKDGSPWKPSQQKRRMTDACKLAKIDPPIRFNDLRHTYASLLAQRGVPLQVIAEVLGHSDTRMTMRHYAHLAPGYVAEAVRANLPRLSSRKPSNVRRIG